MTAQGRGRRDAEDVIEAVDATPVENRGAAIMAVGAQKDLGVGPTGSDRAQKPAQEGLDLLAARPFGGTKHSRDEAALAVEHHDGLKSVFVVVGVEQPQLLAAVDRVERVVDVERDPFGNFGERPAVKVDHRATHPHEGANVRQVLQPRDRRLVHPLAALEAQRICQRIGDDSARRGVIVPTSMLDVSGCRVAFSHGVCGASGVGFLRLLSATRYEASGEMCLLEFADE